MELNLCQKYDLRCKLLPLHSAFRICPTPVSNIRLKTVHDSLSLVYPLSVARNPHLTVSFRCVRYRVDQIDAATATSHTHRPPLVHGVASHGMRYQHQFGRPCTERIEPRVESGQANVDYGWLKADESESRTVEGGCSKLAEVEAYSEGSIFGTNADCGRLKADESESRTVEGGCSKSANVECGGRSLQRR